MGGSNSKTKTNIATKVVVDVMTENIMKCKTNGSALQEFIVSGDGNVIRDTKQIMVFQLSADCAQSAENIADMQQQISQAIEQASSSQSVAMMGVLGKSSSSNSTTIRNEVETVITQKTVQDIVNNVSAQQKMIISGNANIIDNFSQEMTAELVFSNAQDAINNIKTVQDIESQADQTSAATQTNPIAEILDTLIPDMDWVLWVIIAAIVGAVIIAFIYRGAANKKLNMEMGLDPNDPMLYGDPVMDMGYGNQPLDMGYGMGYTPPQSSPYMDQQPQMYEQPMQQYNPQQPQQQTVEYQSTQPMQQQPMQQYNPQQPMA